MGNSFWWRREHFHWCTISQYSEYQPAAFLPVQILTLSLRIRSKEGRLVDALPEGCPTSASLLKARIQNLTTQKHQPAHNIMIIRAANRGDQAPFDFPLVVFLLHNLFHGIAINKPTRVTAPLEANTMLRDP